MTQTHTFTLPCGLRVICAPVQTAGVYLGIAVAHGTRHELPHESGMAHFTEHMTFKGTGRRTAMQIINRLEGVGGELNAYTGKEETVYYASVEPKYVKRAVELLTDIVFGSTYPQEEMEREVEVVCDEIESYNDSPAELIFDDFDALLFGDDAPLGRSILGKADVLRTHTHDDMAAFARRGYRLDNACLYAYGNITPQTLMRSLKCEVLNTKCEPHTSSLKPQTSNLTPQPSHLTLHRDVHQAHVMMGCRTVGVQHPDRIALQLLNNILGGPSLNSRLNLALRERSGLVYTVESNYTGYTDTGVWSIYFGCDHHDVRRCRRLAMRELDRLCQSPLSESKLLAAKRQMLGQLALSYDQHESVALGMGKTYLHYGHYRTQQQIAQQLMEVTAEQLHSVACRTFAEENLSTLIYE